MKKTVRLSLLVQQVRTAGRENAAWLMLMAAFAAVYVIWGSTYLAIHFAIQTMPPLLMLGSRFVIAGALLLGWLLVRGTRLPDAEQTLQASFIGVLTVGIGVGSVAWAEQYIPSGLAALLAATVPMFMVLLEWKWKRGARPSARAFIGLALGFAGVAMLVDPASLMAGLDGAGFASIVVLLGALSWSIGSLYGRDVRIPSDPFMNTAVQMLGGGAALAVLGVLRGEWGVLDMSAISLTSWLAWGPPRR